MASLGKQFERRLLVTRVPRLDGRVEDAQAAVGIHRGRHHPSESNAASPSERSSTIVSVAPVTVVICRATSMCVGT